VGVAELAMTASSSGKDGCVCLENSTVPILLCSLPGRVTDSTLSARMVNSTVASLKVAEP